VAELLAQAGLGTSAFGNLWGMRLFSQPGRIRAGSYRFEGSVTLERVFDDLAAGRVDMVSVTLPEGLTAREMAKILTDAEVTDGKKFVALAYAPDAPARWGVPGPSLEGYLFPDTYKFARGVPAETVIGVLVERFKKVLAETSPTGRAGRFDLRQWVTLASVVEKETGSAPERPLIASVFLNRLDKRMRLESDPTVIYGLTAFDGNLRRGDMHRDTPYNTYTRFGIPPGPICNPGRQSLEAVLRPAVSEYYYFVSRNDGTHKFSRTYGEHVAAVERFQLRRR
jgi:UPF0755 protein